MKKYLICIFSTVNASFVFLLHHFLFLLHTSFCFCYTFHHLPCDIQSFVFLEFFSAMMTSQNSRVIRCPRCNYFLHQPVRLVQNGSPHISFVCMKCAKQLNHIGDSSVSFQSPNIIFLQLLLKKQPFNLSSKCSCGKNFTSYQNFVSHCLKCNMNKD